MSYKFDKQNNRHLMGRGLQVWQIFARTLFGTYLSLLSHLSTLFDTIFSGFAN